MMNQSMVLPRNFARNAFKARYTEDVELKVTDFDENGLKYSIRMNRDGKLYAVIIDWKYTPRNVKIGLAIPEFIEVDL